MDDKNFHGIRKSLIISSFAIVFFIWFANEPHKPIDFLGFSLSITQQHGIYIVMLFWLYFLRRYWLQMDIYNTMVIPYKVAYAETIITKYRNKLLESAFKDADEYAHPDGRSVSKGSTTRPDQHSKNWRLPYSRTYSIFRYHDRDGSKIAQGRTTDQQSWMPPLSIHIKYFLRYCLKQDIFFERLMPLVISFCTGITILVKFTIWGWPIVVDFLRDMIT